MTLERVLHQTKNENAHHFVVHGERGIGKSSLLYYIDWIATGRIPTLHNGTFKFLTVNVELEPMNTYADIIRKVGAELQRTVASEDRAKELAKSAWDFLRRWEVMGVKYSQEVRLQQPHELLDDLTHTVHRVLLALGDQFDGVLILIDEADKPPASANLGEFAKLFTERLTKRGSNRVCLGLAGVSGLLQKLKRSHASAPRIFEILTLEPLLPNERKDVVRRGLAVAQEKAGLKVDVTPDAENWISEFSEGYPHFIQQFGYSAFEQDKDNLITEADVIEGAFRENGAFQQLGLKYFEDLYFDQIGSEEYREVLQFMSKRLDGWVSKEEIRKATKIKETTLTNAITALKKRSIIIPKQGQKGVYRLPTKSFAVWIGSYTKATALLQSNGTGELPFPAESRNS